MRRSAAPSQNASKRAKFVPPYISSDALKSDTNPEKQNILHCTSATSNASVAIIKGTLKPDHFHREVKNPVRSTADVLGLIKIHQATETPNIQEDKDFEPLSSPLPDNNSEIRRKLLSYMISENYVNNKSCSGESSNKNKLEEASSNQESTDLIKPTGRIHGADKYFNVVWCKLSMKKHKKWEGDAILIIQGRTAILKDLEGGKEIARASGYKLKDFEALEDGSRLTVGGKECEIQSEVTPEEYFSGRCFTALALQTHESSKKEIEAPRTFGKLVNKKNNTFRRCDIVKCGTPLYPSDAPDALVMPRPNSLQQWSENKENLPVVDVVVDPLLCRSLRSHQREGVVFLYECIMGMRNSSLQGAILADEMGLGKTLQCITLIWTLLKQGPYGGKPVLRKVIIITPSSLVKNWTKEFKKWLGYERLKIFAVDQHHKVQDYQKNPFCPVLIISYEMFVRCHELLNSINFDLLICDEAHRLKNTKIKTTSLIANISTNRRILLTGTPIQNDLQEFYSIADFCNPGILGTSASFHRVFEEPILQSQQPHSSEEVRKLGEARSEELNQMISLFVLRRTQDVINSYLPDKVEAVVFCSPSPLQIRLYRQLLSSRIVKDCLSSWACMDSSSHLMCIAALRKLCNHPLLLYQRSKQGCDASKTQDDNVSNSIYSVVEDIFPKDYHYKTNLESSSGKMNVLTCMLQALYQKEPKEKIVLVSSFTKTLDILQQLCTKKNYSFVRLDGSTPTASRQDIVESFNSPHSKTFVFLLSSKAGGVGLNLIGASRILLYDIDWNPASDLQAMARVWRDGQEKDVYIYRLLTAGTIEEKIYQRQITKQGLSSTVVDNKEKGLTQFSLADLKDLFSFQEGALCTTHDLLSCNCDDKLTINIDHETKLPENDTEERKCQLLSIIKQTPVLTKNPGMSELMKWEHIRSPINPSLVQDEVLSAGQNGITFIFKSRNMP